MQLLVSIEDASGGERVCAETPDGAVAVEVVPAPGSLDEGSCQLAVLPDGTARVVGGDGCVRDGAAPGDCVSP